MKLYIDTKPTLEWVDLNELRLVCHSLYGTYSVMQQRTSGNKYLVWFYCYSHPEWESKHDTLSEAKAAAQADYDRRTAERFREVQVPEGHIGIDGVAYRLIIKEQ